MINGYDFTVEYEAGATFASRAWSLVGPEAVGLVSRQATGRLKGNPTAPTVDWLYGAIDWLLVRIR